MPPITHAHNRKDTPHPRRGILERGPARPRRFLHLRAPSSPLVSSSPLPSSPSPLPLQGSNLFPGYPSSSLDSSHLDPASGDRSPNGEIAHKLPKSCLMQPLTHVVGQTASQAIPIIEDESDAVVRDTSPDLSYDATLKRLSAITCLRERFHNNDVDSSTDNMLDESDDDADAEHEVDGKPWPHEDESDDSTLGFVSRCAKEYEEEEKQDIFDNGNSGDEDELAADAGIAEWAHCDDETDLEDMNIDLDDHYIRQRSHIDDTIIDPVPEASDAIQGGGAAVNQTGTGNSFADFFKIQLRVSCLDRKENVQLWKIFELEETKRHVDAGLAAALRKKQIIAKEKSRVLSEMVLQQGIFEVSEDLWQAYTEFCESLEPEFGSRGGWSITCHWDHNGSYVNYDPDLSLFREHTDMPYWDCNFRCEASTIKPYINALAEHVVEFWPVQSPEPLPFSGANTTWGKKYTELYRLASEAACRGSEVAMDMLVALPDQHASCHGGWLFEYGFAEELKDHPVKSRRWTYRTARMIDVPVDPARKRERLEAFLVPELFSDD
ncbi:uncharacterized protein BCR38DRAFT_476908 [Pseudomassariella vexata]|uniref:Uncharacterized protein n=1 Tax=Pseudomassariella vexata TaxID=1141098 RepID=A0A1Y2DLK6_9PEZI|nr:uncharacterized protein BCR38DRAFT_476908 [Pseudomassariella vexata]ORY60016.1 hypothetical protein BCR38DRAFT_476908 [Pseudomassariella vexata]